MKYPVTNRSFALLAALLLYAASSSASMGSPATQLRLYGPGGPHHALQECANLYFERHGVVVGVTRAGPVELARRLKEDGDIYFTGAEYMLEDFARENPNLIDVSTAEEIFERRVGILVRKGNPLDIKGAHSLRSEKVDLMVADLENMESFLGPEGERPSKAPRRVFKGSDGLKAWRSSPEIDAWITYKSWHLPLEDESEFIEYACHHSLRHTMVAITHRSEKRKEAKHFIDFLKSQEARRIFLKHGWE